MIAEHGRDLEPRALPAPVPARLFAELQMGL
jgi:hypothetical protein